LTIPPIRADASVLQPIRQQPSGPAAVSAAVGVKTLPALTGLLSHSLDVRDLCKRASQQAAGVASDSRGLLLGDRRQQLLEVIVSLLERVPILLGGAVALAEVMTGLVLGDDRRADDVIPETTPGSDAAPRTAAA
jgi:hypothetical protein